MSKKPDSASLLSGKPQVIFEISDVVGLAKKLREKYPELFQHIHIGDVQYTGRYMTDYDIADGVPSYLRKERIHLADREVRIVIFPYDGVAPQIIYTEADPEIAAFFKRMN